MHYWRKIRIITNKNRICTIQILILFVINQFSNLHVNYYLHLTARLTSLDTPSPSVFHPWHVYWPLSDLVTRCTTKLWLLMMIPFPTSWCRVSPLIKQIVRNFNEWSSILQNIGTSLGSHQFGNIWPTNPASNINSKLSLSIFRLFLDMYNSHFHALTNLLATLEQGTYMFDSKRTSLSRH